MLSTSKAIYVEDTFSYRDYVCQVSKTTTYVCNRFNTSFRSLILLVFNTARDQKTNQATSNLNQKFWNKSTLIWVGFLGFVFTPLLHRDYYSLKMDIFIWIRISCILYIRLLWPISGLTKISEGKKSLYKSISKSIYVDTYYLFLIIVTE